MNALNLIQFENSLVFADAPAAGMSVGAIIGIIIGAVILLIFFFSFFPVGLAISAGASGVHVGLFQLVGMRIRKVNPHRIVEPLIKATKAGLDLNLNKMEAHYLAGGNVDRVVNALIASQRAGIALDFEKACAIIFCTPDGPLQAGSRICAIGGDPIDSEEALNKVLELEKNRTLGRMVTVETQAPNQKPITKLITLEDPRKVAEYLITQMPYAGEKEKDGWIYN